MVRRIIGGMFGLATGRGTSYGFLPALAGDVRLLADARSGLYLLLRELRPPALWLPSYLCRALLEPAAALGIPHRFYELSADFGMRTDRWLREVQPGDVVLAIDFFGFPFSRPVLVAAGDAGAVTVRDASQALLSPADRDSDFVLYSPRKFVGVPDGGILRLNFPRGAFPVGLEPAPEQWFQLALRAAELRAEFDAGAATDWYPLFQAGEEAAPTGPFAMSGLAAELLRHAFDYEAIAARRRANYRQLSAALADVALLPELPPEVVPLGFPIRVPGRDELRAALFARQIFPPVHWRLDGVVPNDCQESHTLSRQLLTLPCDQRYDADDMADVIAAVRQSLAPRA